MWTSLDATTCPRGSQCENVVIKGMTRVIEKEDGKKYLFLSGKSQWEGPPRNLDLNFIWWVAQATPDGKSVYFVTSYWPEKPNRWRTVTAKSSCSLEDMEKCLGKVLEK